MNKQNKKSRSTYLVTGGCGFIGSHIVDNLIISGHKVVVIDNLSTGVKANLHKLATLYEINITDFESIKRIFLKVKPDYVYHLAANANVPLSVKLPLFDFQSLHGALNIIEASKIAKVKRLLYFSSGFIYGNVKERPINEGQLFQPISPYSISKSTVEYYLEFYKKTYDLSYVVVRPATVYGPRQVAGAMNDYINCLYNNKQAKIYGDGSKTRDYIFIHDVVEAVVKLIHTPINHKKEIPIYNLGTGVETSLLRIYRLIAGYLHKTPNPIYCENRKGELNKYSLENSKIEKKLSWKPRFTIEEGLKKTLRYRGYI